MHDYPIDLKEIVAWFRSKEQALKAFDITLADVRERSRTDKPAVVADFDTASAIGRINVWVSGEADFEVLRRSDGKHAFLRHEVVSSLSAPLLETAYDHFLRKMTHPDTDGAGGQ